MQAPNSIIAAIEGAISFWNNNIGSYLLMVLLLPVGIMFTIMLGLPQITRLRHAVDLVRGKFNDPTHQGDVSHFQALCAALSATVGTGNIVGVALAISWGGPGAVFWMWVTGFLGMATKAASCSLAVHYRRINADGSVSGGPMYYISRGLRHGMGWAAPILAAVFSIAGIFGSFGTGNMAQSNSVAQALQGSYGVSPYISGLVLAVLVFVVIVGGVRRIGAFAAKMVPFMATIYIGGALLVLVAFAPQIPQAFALIFRSAFSGTAATGGFAGATFAMAARWGIARGLFSNEAGQGSTPIFHAAARTNIPAREGMVALLEPLSDTLITCTMTALVILVSGDWINTPLEGAELTASAFSSGLNFLGMASLGNHVVAIGLILFALSTAICWSYYGDRCTQYLLGDRFITPYRVVYCALLFVGAIVPLTLVWSFTDMMVCFMAIPNLIALVMLSPQARSMFKSYQVPSLPSQHAPAPPAAAPPGQA